MVQFETSQKYVNLVKIFNDKNIFNMHILQRMSSAFELNSGLCQVYVFSLTLFYIINTYIQIHTLLNKIMM